MSKIPKNSPARVAPDSSVHSGLMFSSNHASFALHHHSSPAPHIKCINFLPRPFSLSRSVLRTVLLGISRHSPVSLLSQACLSIISLFSSPIAALSVAILLRNYVYKMMTSHWLIIIVMWCGTHLLYKSSASESTAGYTLVCCMGYFTALAWTPDRMGQQLSVSLLKGAGKVWYQTKLARLRNKRTEYGSWAKTRQYPAIHTNYMISHCTTLQ